MAQKNGSLLPFTRDAAFINRRAQARREAGENLEALRLFRRAMEAAPDNLEYCVDTAELLNHMGCLKASYELINSLINSGRISRALRSGTASSSALFGQACNLSSLGCTRSAIAMLRRIRGLPMDEECAEGLCDLRTHLAAEELLRATVLRRNRLLRRMNDCADAHDALRACAVARRYLRQRPGDPLAHAAMAWAQMLRGNQPASMEHLVHALSMKHQDPWVLSIAARMLDSGEHGQARPALENAYALSGDPYCDRTLLKQASALGMDALVMDISARLLEADCCDPHASACHAVAMVNMGEPARAALAVLRRSLEVYPGDATAGHYLRLIEQLKPDDRPLPYPVNAMPREWARAVAGLRIRLFSGDVSALAGDAHLIGLLEWGLYCPSGEVCESSAALLSRIGGDLAREALWRCLTSYERPNGKLRAILSLMSEADIPLPRLVFAGGRLQKLSGRMISRMAAEDKTCVAVRAAARRLHEYPDAAVELSAMLFFADGAAHDAHLMSSALECAYRIAHREFIDLRALARRRHLSCARLMRAVNSLIQTYHPQEEPQ